MYEPGMSIGRKIRELKHDFFIGGCPYVFILSIGLLQISIHLSFGCGLQVYLYLIEAWISALNCFLTISLSILWFARFIGISQWPNYPLSFILFMHVGLCF